MQLKLQRTSDGTGFVIVVEGRDESIAIPLAQSLSHQVERMVRAEEIPTNNIPLLLPHMLERKR